MTVALISYGSPTAITLTLASLATASTLLTGRESTVVNSTTSLSVDYLVGGTITVSSAGATANTQIEVWSYGSYDGTNYSGGATGSDAALTVTNTKNQMRLLTTIPVSTTSSQAYVWGPFSVAQAYGGAPPVKWGVFVTHNTGANLNASGQETDYIPISYTSS